MPVQDFYDFQEALDELFKINGNKLGPLYSRVFVTFVDYFHFTRGWCYFREDFRVVLEEEIRELSWFLREEEDEFTTLKLQEYETIWEKFEF